MNDHSEFPGGFFSYPIKGRNTGHQPTCENNEKSVKRQ